MKKRELIKKLDAELNILGSISKSVKKQYNNIEIFKSNLENSFNIGYVRDEMSNLFDEYTESINNREHHKDLNYSDWLEKELVNSRILAINLIAGRKASTNKKRVIQLDINGEFINSFESTIEASDLTGVSRPSISRAINNKRPHGGGFIWKIDNSKD